MARHKASRQAFTLVELLVVIGIIAVLIGILLPSLSKAREQAKATQCLANLRSIASAAMNYASDYKGAMLPAETTHINPVTGSMGTVWWWAYLVDGGYLTAARVPAAQYATMGPQYNKSVLYCPSSAVDVDFLGGSQNGTRADRISADGDKAIREHTEDGDGLDCWYGINAGSDTAAGDRSVTGPPAVDHQNAVMNYFNTMSVVHRASDMVFFFDGQIDRVAGAGNTDSTANRVICRHTRRTRVNIAFFDGHAASFLGSELPGGYAAKKDDMRLPNLQLYASPIWLIEQGNN